MKYFVVKTKCGHVGKNKYIIIDFPVNGEDAREAARKARNIPRVKKHLKDAIVSVKEISYDEYVEIYNNNKNDEYLKCSNKQELLLIDNIEDRIHSLEKNYHRRKREIRDFRWFHKVLVKNYKKYILKYVEV